MLQIRVAVAPQYEQEDEAPDEGSDRENGRIDDYGEVSVALILPPTADETLLGGTSARHFSLPGVMLSRLVPSDEQFKPKLALLQSQILLRLVHVLYSD